MRILTNLTLLVPQYQTLIVFLLDGLCLRNVDITHQILRLLLELLNACFSQQLPLPPSPVFTLQDKYYKTVKSYLAYISWNARFPIVRQVKIRMKVNMKIHYYEVNIGVKKGDDATEVEVVDHYGFLSPNKFKKQAQGRSLEQALDTQFASGRVLAKITSQLGQTGRCCL